MSLDSDSVFCKRCSGNGGAGCLKRCGLCISISTCEDLFAGLQQYRSSKSCTELQCL